MDVDIANWLTVNQLPGIGPGKLIQLMQRVDHQPEQLIQQSNSTLSEWGLNSEQLKSLRDPPVALFERVVAWLASSPQHFFLTYRSELYPSQLLQVARFPPLLFGIGDVSHLQKTQLAVVGSRNPTAQAKQFTADMCQQLSERGWVVTSGLAMGIDACAHQGAVWANAPTIAVLGVGIDQIYPRRNRKLAEQIMACDGVIVSEFAPGVPALAQNFPRRNRIISGLSRGTLVIEAAIKSGSLISARYAIEQGREVFAVPGSIHNPLSKGCHFLIKQGAKLVECIEDIEEEFANLTWLTEPVVIDGKQKSTPQSLATDTLLDSVDYEATSIDEVAERSQLSIEEVTVALLDYELRGLVAAVPGGYIKLRG